METNDGEELCDGIDNNCDGETDEPFDFDTLASHCGGCNNDCLIKGSLWPDYGNEVPENMAAASCDNGQCEVLTCDPGYMDDPESTYEDCNRHIKQLSLGASHSCALLSNNTVRCWGLNTSGQLGLETTDDTSQTPVSAGLSLSSGIAIESVAAGDLHTCALFSDDTIRCWGNNRFGQLGGSVNIGTDNANYSPVSLNFGTEIKNITAGAAHTCALLSDSTIRCWGLNHYGQLGGNVNIGTNNANYTAVSVNLGSEVKDIAAGGNHNCATLSDNTIRCWGYNSFGQLGANVNLGTENANYMPVSLNLGSEIKSIDAGSGHTCAVMSDDTIRCWGNNSYGQLGTETASNENPNPVSVGLSLSSGTTIQNVALGSSHSCATLSNNTAVCWGWNYFGQLGSSVSGENHPDPVNVEFDLSSGTSIESIAAGSLHSCAVLSDVTVQCWGYNINDQLGGIPSGLGRTATVENLF